ncbi:salicylate hydroxylase [Pholiota conissans]|uniref:Salicylate hydroxylase n=1 Tax=Pholiota conissans TaxID=109636 RepID=A0A9P5YND9_9AGAR|nr:salicylate hydroxylase [Pholiota conissans]
MNSASHPDRPVRVAIVGAGIGGLTLSAALGALQEQQKSESNLKIDLYESASIISEIGAGITLWPRVWKIMQSIDLGESLVQFLPRPPDNSTRLVFQLRKADQQEGEFIHDIMMEGGSTTFHRADLQQTLVSKLTGDLHLGHRFASYEEVDEEIRIHFENGATATCDLLIGMDGIKSTVRKSLLIKQGLPNSPSMEPIWSGTIAYRGLVPRDELDKIFPGHRSITTPMMHVVAYPISRQFVNVAAFVTYPSKKGTPYDNSPMTADQIHQELVSLYASFEKEVKVLLDCLTQPLKWPINQVIPLESYVCRHALIAGDAAHGLPPHQGSGASTAIEDAYILAILLTSPSCTLPNLSKIASIYDSIRCPKGNRALDTAIGCGQLLDLVFPGLEDVNEGDGEVDKKLLETLGKKVSAEWSWVWKESAEDDRGRALDMLQK